VVGLLVVVQVVVTLVVRLLVDKVVVAQVTLRQVRLVLLEPQILEVVPVVVQLQVDKERMGVVE
tara:strand:+ start:468 stop:659 length:192 start_codon:yes stop_codon:yes gene_type:complete